MTTTAVSPAESFAPESVPIRPIQTDVDNTNSLALSAPSTEPSPTEDPPPQTPQSPSRNRPELNISENDPNAFKVTILLASSGYRTQVSINRSFLEKSSIVGGDGFLVSQLKNAIWKDWPSGIAISSLYDF